MERNSFADAVKRIEEINSIVTKLDPAVREKAFELLTQAAADLPAVSEKIVSRKAGKTATHDSDHAGLFARVSHDKPSDNVLLVAADLYSRFGTDPFSEQEVRDVAADVGLTLPERVDMTLRAAQREGKALFRRVGKARYRPTVHGEIFLKATYGVERGREKRDGADPIA